MTKNYIVVGLAFGDEGKGSIVDFLAHQTEDPPIIVRFNGGPQAAHNVVTPEGTHHTFAQFGSGMFRPGTKTHLSRFMLVNPLNLLTEFQHLFSVHGYSEINIAESCPVITPYHQALNRLREMSRGEDRHGSCGQGVGELMADMEAHPHMVLRYGDLQSRQITETKLKFWRDYKEVQAEEFGPHPEADIFADDNLIATLIESYQYCINRLADVVADDWLDAQLGRRSVIFEGAQGVLLDETYGFNPYTTWSTTTPKNAQLLLGSHEAETVGVVRSYYTRHGAGPFPTEWPEAELGVTEQHNTTGEYQGDFRRGVFDETLFKYATRVCAREGGIDTLAVTHFRVNFPVRRYELPFDISTIPNPTEMDQAAMTAGVQDVTAWSAAGVQWGDIEEASGASNFIISDGPTRANKVYTSFLRVRSQDRYNNRWSTTSSTV